MHIQRLPHTTGSATQFSARKGAQVRSIDLFRRLRPCAAVNDVPNELLLALEEESSATLLPLKASQFPQGFSGYFGSASRAIDVPGSPPKLQRDQQNPSIAPIHASPQKRQRQSPASGDQQLSVYAIQRKVDEVLQASGQGDLEGWLAAELSAASHWRVVQAVLSRAGNPHSPQPTASQHRHAALSLTLCEQAVITLARLGPSPELWSTPGWGAQQWEELGRQLAQSLSAHCPTPPAHAGDTQQLQGALLAAAQGSPSQAVHVVQCLAQLGGSFVCRPYISQVVVLMVTHPEGPAAWGPDALTTLLSACASLQHLIRHSARQQCALAAVDLLPAMSAPQVAASLGALGHYQQAGSTRQQLQQQLEQEGLMPREGSGPAPGSSPGLVVDAAHTQGGGQLSYSQLAVERLEKLGFQGLTMAEAGAALQGLGAAKYWPGEEWVGRLLEAVCSPQQAGSSARTHEDRKLLGADGHSSSFQGALALVQGLASHGAPPPYQVLQELLTALQPAGPPHALSSPPKAPPPASAVASAVRSLVQLQVPVPGAWCSGLVGYLGALTPGVDGSIICGLVGHLPSLLLGPSALLATPEGTLAPSPASSLKRQQHRSTLQPGMDEKQRAFVRSWVQDNIALLEGVVEGLGTYLGSATAKDLHGVITGFAQIRFYPGAKFLQWHQAACLRLGSTFPAPMLLQVRAAYSALGFMPEQRVVALMEKAQQRIEKKARQQVKRAGEAAQAIQPKYRQAHKTPFLVNGSTRTNGIQYKLGGGGRKQQHRSTFGKRRAEQKQRAEEDDLADLLKDV